MIQLTISRWRDHPGLSAWTHCRIPRILITNRGRQGCQSQEKFENTKLLVLNMEKGATSLGMQLASRNWKRQGNRSSPGASERTQSCWRLHVSPVRPISTSDLQNCRTINACGFKSLSVWSFATAAMENKQSWDLAPTLNQVSSTLKHESLWDINQNATLLIYREVDL